MSEEEKKERGKKRKSRHRARIEEKSIMQKCYVLTTFGSTLQERGSAV